jgi:hypothetical protein
MMEALRTWFSWWIFGAKTAWWKLRHGPQSRAFIFARQGVYYDLYRAHRIYNSKRGEIYSYNGDDVVFVFYDEIKGDTIKRSKDYFEVWEDERVLFVVDGEVVACPVAGTGVPMEGEILSNFIQGNIAEQISRSFRDGSGFNLGSMKWFLLIGGIILILFVVYKYVLNGHLPGVSGNVTVPTPVPTFTPAATPLFSTIQWIVWGVSNV